MIWALLALIVSFFGGGNETFFLTPNFKKNVKTYVEDKGRRKEIFTMIKEAKKNQKKFIKEKRKYLKKAAKVSLDPHSPREDLYNLFMEHHNKRLEMQASGIDIEIKMKSITTKDEWDQIINNVIVNPDKNKLEKKIIKVSKKVYDNLVKSVNTNVADSLKRNSILDAITDQQTEFNNFMNSFVNMNYKELESIRGYDVKKEEYQKLANKFNKERKEVVLKIFDLRNVILKNTTADEWKIIVKKFNKLFK